jgi:hypothetical protein
MVLPWRWFAGLYVVSTLVGAGITYLVRGDLGSFLDPVFHLFFAAGWLVSGFLLRWLADREERRARS